MTKYIVPFIAFAVSYLIGIYAWANILLPLTKGIPMLLKQGSDLKLSHFLPPIISSIILFLAIWFGLNYWYEARYVIYLGFGVPLVQIIIKAIKGGADLKSETEESYSGKLRGSGNTKAQHDEDMAILSSFGKSLQKISENGNSSSSQMELEYPIEKIELAMERVKKSDNVSIEYKSVIAYCEPYLKILKQNSKREI